MSNSIIKEITKTFLFHGGWLQQSCEAMPHTTICHRNTGSPMKLISMARGVEMMKYWKIFLHVCSGLTANIWNRGRNIFGDGTRSFWLSTCDLLHQDLAEFRHVISPDCIETLWYMPGYITTITRHFDSCSTACTAPHQYWDMIQVDAHDLACSFNSPQISEFYLYCINTDVYFVLWFPNQAVCIQWQCMSSSQNSLSQSLIQICKHKLSHNSGTNILRKPSFIIF